VIGCLAAALVSGSKDKGQPPRGVQPHNFFGVGGYDGFGAHVAPIHAYTGVNFDEGPAQKLVEHSSGYSVGLPSHGHTLESAGSVGVSSDGLGEVSGHVEEISHGAAGLTDQTLGHSVKGQDLSGHGLTGHSYGAPGFAGPGLTVPSYGGHGLGYPGHGFGYGGHGMSPYGGFGAFGKGYGKLAQPMYVFIQDDASDSGKGKGKGKGGLFGGKGKGEKGGKGKGGGSDYDTYDTSYWSHDYDDSEGKGKGKGKGKGGLFKELEKGFKSVSNYWNDYMAYNSYETAGHGYGPRVIHAAPLKVGHGYGPGIGHGFAYQGVSHGHTNDIQVAPPIVGGLGHFKAHGPHPGYRAYVGHYGGSGLEGSEGKGKGKGGKGGKGKGSKKGSGSSNDGAYASHIAIAAPIGGHLHHPMPYPYMGGYGGHAGHSLGHAFKSAPAIPASAPIIAPKAPSLPTIPAAAPILHTAPKAPLPSYGPIGVPGYGGAPINLGGHQAFGLDYDEEYDDGWFSSGYEKMKKEFDKAYKGVKGLFSDDKGKGGKGEKGGKGSKGGKKEEEVDSGHIVFVNKPIYAPRPPHFHKGFFAQPGYGLPGPFHGMGSYGGHGVSLGHAGSLQKHNFGLSEGIALDGDVSYTKGVPVVETKTQEVAAAPTKATQTSFTVTHTSVGSAPEEVVKTEHKSDEVTVSEGSTVSSYASHK